MVVVKWSACSPSTTTIRVRIPHEAYSFSVKIVFEKNENKHKNVTRQHHFDRLFCQVNVCLTKCHVAQIYCWPDVEHRKWSYAYHTIVQLTNCQVGGATIGQWIRLCLPSCRPAFESQANHLLFSQFVFELCHVEKTKINKQRGHF